MLSTTATYIEEPVAVSLSARKGRRVRSRHVRVARSQLVFGLGFPLLCAVLGVLGFQRLSILDRDLGAMREGLERRLQQVDAGLRFDAKRQQLLLGIRDEMGAANPRLSVDAAQAYATHLMAACEKYPAVDPRLLLAVGIVESRFDATATSHARARGLYQIWPATGRTLASMQGWPYSDALLFDPEKNTLLAAFYLDLLFTAHNDERLVLAEYNGGPRNAGYLRAGDRRVSSETRTYVARVLQQFERLKKKLEPAVEPSAADTDRG